MSGDILDDTIHEVEPERRARVGWQWILLAVVAAWFVGSHFARATPPAPAVVEREPLRDIPRGARTGPLFLTTSSTSTTSTATCTGLAPGPDWTCQNGSWQLGGSAAASTATGSGGGGANRAAGGCLTETPGPSFVCQDGLWIIPAPSGPTANGALNQGTAASGGGASA